MGNNSPSFFSIRENNLDNITIPESIYLDTSFIYEIYHPNSRYNNDCINFMEKAITENNTLFSVSQHVMAELEHILHNNLYEVVKGYNNLNNKEDINYRKIVDQEYKRISNALYKSGICFIEPLQDQEYSDLRHAVGTLYGLGSYDSIHVTSMLVSGENSIAAVDGHFTNVPHINSYGPSWGYQNDQNSTFKEYSDEIIDDIFDEYDSLNS